VDIEDIRQRLLSRRAELRAREVGANAGLRQPLDLSGSDIGDASNQSEQNGVLSALSRAADAELKRVDHALHRLEEGRYTTCVTCGEEIEPRRLLAVPYTDRCILCAERSANG